jgi:hypothetical protein
MAPTPLLRTYLDPEARLIGEVVVIVVIVLVVDVAQALRRLEGEGLTAEAAPSL